MARYRKLESLDDFQRALKNKYGLGEGPSYKPWLRVQDVRSCGNSGKIQGIKTHREHHTLSEYESCFFYLAEYCDSVIDIREQFPLLPLDLSVRIAKTLGVDHPSLPISKVFNIMTTDFVLTCSDGVKTWYEAITVKLAEYLKDKRVAEKLDIERVWWQLQGIRFHIFIMTEENKIQSQNIQWFSAPYRQGRRFTDELIYQALSLMQTGTLLAEDLCNSFIQEPEVEHDDALVLLKMLISKKLVELDLGKPIAETEILHIINILNNKVMQQHAS